MCAKTKRRGASQRGSIGGLISLPHQGSLRQTFTVKSFGQVEAFHDRAFSVQYNHESADVNYPKTCAEKLQADFFLFPSLFEATSAVQGIFVPDISEIFRGPKEGGVLIKGGFQ